MKMVDDVKWFGIIMDKWDCGYRLGRGVTQ